MDAFDDLPLMRAFICVVESGSISAGARRMKIRILPRWKAKDLPVHVVYSAGRVLPIRVRAFVDFAVGYTTKALGSSSINDTKSDTNRLDFVSSR